MSRKKIGLALSGGAARGFAHLGVLKAFKENDIPIDVIAGTSAGSFAGAAWAAGMSVESITEMGRDINWLKVSSFSWTTKGLISNKPISDIIRNDFPFNRFEDLLIPFAAVTTDMDTWTEMVFKNEGDVGPAVAASCAVPGVFAPVKIGDGLFVDGGVVSPVPTAAARALGADVVIAVDVISSGAGFRGRPSTLIGILLQSGLMLIRTASQHQSGLADIQIIPELSHMRPDEIGKMDEFVELGEKAALGKLEEIKRIAEL